MLLVQFLLLNSSLNVRRWLVSHPCMKCSLQKDEIMYSGDLLRVCELSNLKCISKKLHIMAVIILFQNHVCKFFFPQ